MFIHLLNECIIFSLSTREKHDTNSKHNNCIYCCFLFVCWVHGTATSQKLGSSTDLSTSSTSQTLLKVLQVVSSIEKSALSTNSSTSKMLSSNKSDMFFGEVLIMNLSNVFITPNEHSSFKCIVIQTQHLFSSNGSCLCVAGNWVNPFNAD